MTQQSYDIILSCIQHGAPAISNRLIQEFNIVISDSNKFREMNKHKAIIDEVDNNTENKEGE